MASIKKTARGGYRVQLYVQGERDSGTFPTKRDAHQWAEVRSAEMRRSPRLTGKHTLADALNKFHDEEADKRPGGRWEKVRITALLKMETLPRHKPVVELVAEDFRAWRDPKMAMVYYNPSPDDIATQIERGLSRK